MPLTPGTRLGPYEILAPIGAGGMGEVYRARDTKLGRELAVKVLPEALAQNPERLARFEREAKVLASLNHPHIAQIYGVEGRALIMELVAGENLAGPLPLEIALDYARQIAEGLEAAHEKGIVHRDLKPANVRVTPEGVVKVLDFGLAAVAQDSSAPESNLTNSPTLTLAATQVGVLLGTAGYMSPEQAVGKPVDKRADIWAFGVVLWELLTGTRLFGAGETVSHTLADVLRAPIDFTSLPASTPAPIRELLRRCLDRDVRTRLRDIGEARVAIARYLAAPAGEASEAPAQRPSKVSWVWAAVATVAAVALGYLHFREAPPRVAKLSVLPPEKGEFVTNTGPPALSPDGRYLVFRGSTEGKSALWVRDLDSPTPRLLPGSENAVSPFWSPDSRFVGFAAEGKLKKVDVTGGPALTICDAAFPRGASWSKDDVILFAPGPATAILRVPASGGAPTQVTELDQSRNEISHRWPWFLPDGRHLLYLARSSDSGKTGVFAGDLQSKERKLILAGNTNAIYIPGHLLFVRDRTLMVQPFDAGRLTLTGDAVPVAEQVDFINANNYGVFTASQTGVLAYSSGGIGGNLQITFFDRSGKAVGTAGKPVDIEWASLSPDGKSLATDRLDPQTGRRDIWLYDLVRGTEQRLTFVGESRFPIWSPDGARIAFQGDRGGGRKVHVKAANGTGQEEVLDTGGPVPTDWSRDGRYLLSATANGNPKTGNDIWVLPLADKKAFPLLQTEFQESYNKLSPDGRWLAYQSTESKRNEIYVMTFPMPGGKWQISTAGGTLPVWSRDGRELFYVSYDNKMMAVEIKPGAQFAAGVPHPLFDVRMGSSNPNFDVGPDGRFLIPTPAEQSGNTPMTMVLNWTAGLKR